MTLLWNDPIPVTAASYYNGVSDTEWDRVLIRMNKDSQHGDSALIGLSDVWFKLRRIESMTKKTRAYSHTETDGQQADYELIVCTGGRLQFSLGNRRCELGGGSSMIVRSGERTSAEIDEESQGYILSFTMYRELDELEHSESRVTKQDRFPVDTEIVIPSSVPFLELCDEVYTHWSGGSPVGPFRSQGLFQQLLYLLFIDM